MTSRQSDGKVIQIQSKEEYDKLLVESGDTLLVVDFYADWCGPCKVIGPKVAALAEINKEVLFAKVNVDDQSEIAEACSISAMPTFQFFKGGKKVHEFKGASEDQLLAGISKHK